ncbi:zinc finger protein 236 [Esox lucius]|uniref:C2H2-type domain-containing protein n=1 Tax=Esox lucius TaxID=8010 RepID=A0A3P8YG36_ESOLU|nr:zinc finger protein 236 [Esox lucius]XP_019896281.2 zinc finger protein 236 [Esox lucius]
MKAEDGTGNGESDGTQIRNGSPILLQMPLICHTAKAEGAGGKKGDDQRLTPPLQPPSRCLSGNGRPAEEGGVERAEAWKGRGEKKQEEGGVALDLSLPKKRESKDRRLWHESSLLMEVDEVEGDGDRDVVEEDDGDEYESILRIDGADILGGPLLSPTFCSTSMFPFLSSLDSDCEGLLLIDDQGIPYTLTPEGHKVPQIDQLKRASPQTGQSLAPSNSVVVSSDMAAPGATQLSQSLVTPPTHNHNLCPAPLTSTNPSQNEEHMKNTEPLTTTELSQNVGPCKVVDSDVKAVCEARVMGSVLPHPPTHPIQILPSSSLQLSTPLAKTDTNPGLAFTLPLSLIQNSPGASASMLLLLSTSTSSQSFSTSTPIALIDPSTGQLSQITASSLSSLSLSSPLPLSVSPGQIVTSESSLPAVLSQPVIRGPPDNPVAVLSRVTPSMNPVTPLTPFSAASSTPKQPIAEESSNALPVNSPLITRSSESDPDPQSLSTEEKQMVTTPNRSPPTNASLLTHPQSPSMTFDPSIEAVNQSTAPESERSSLPWNDHLYFSSTAPPSPPLVTVVPSGTPRNLEPLDPLDLVSPGSPPSTGPRRVLYCPLCPRIFYYVSDLERHSITHSQNKPHVCLQCGKAFKRSSHLQRHNHIHTGQRNFVCPICSKRFREAGELQRHQRVHTGEKPYQCSLCHTRFAERNTLRRHTKRKHPYHQAAVDMLTEGGDGRGAGEGEEETEEWYSSTVSNLENSDSEPDSEVIS